MAPDMSIHMLPMEAMEWSGNQLFEYMTGRKINAEPNIDRLLNEGRIDPSEAEGWSMGDCMDALVVRVIKTKQTGFLTHPKLSISFVPATRREMLEAVDIPEECRFGADDIHEINVCDGGAPPHIHDRRCNWTRWLRLGYDRNHTDLPMYIFVFYENWVDSALYSGNVTHEDFCRAIEFIEERTTRDVNFISPGSDLINALKPDITRNYLYNVPDAHEVADKKAARNRAKRERRKERKRELAAEKAQEEAQRERERKEKDDGIEGIHKGKKGCQQLAEEETARRRKELAESHREWERLHPKNERIAVRGESHKETPQVPKPEPTMEERIARMDFEEKREDRRFDAEQKKAAAHTDKMLRDAEAKAKAEREAVKQAGMRIAEAANTKAPPMTFARKAGL